MARERLTDKRVALMKAPATGRAEIFDTIRTGLCFRVTDKGAKSFSHVYRFNGELRRDTLGPYPKISLAKAREKAGQATELIGRDLDPRITKAVADAQEAARKTNTVQTVGEQFIKKHLAQHRSDEPERILRREVLPVWGRRTMVSITKADVLELIEGIAERGAGVLANRTLARLKTFFGWALDRDIIGADPTARVRKPTRETARERVLADAELAAFWRGCNTLGRPFGDLFKVLAMTAQRKTEISDLSWPEINANERTLEFAGERYKTGRPHVVPVPDDALQILGQMPIVGDSAHFVFTTNGTAAVSGFSKAKALLDGYMLDELRRDIDKPDEVKLERWTIHDLRRTARTNFSKLGIPSDIGERILGHAIGGVRAVYDRHQFVPEMRDALNRWAAHLDGIVNPRPSRVVDLPKRKARR